MERAGEKVMDVVADDDDDDDDEDNDNNKQAQDPNGHVSSS